MQKADLQQINGKSFLSPSTVQVVDTDNSNCSVMWNQNDVYKNEQSFSSGDRCVDATAVGQVRPRSIYRSHVASFTSTAVCCFVDRVSQNVLSNLQVCLFCNSSTTARLQINPTSQKMFNQPSPQPLWDVSPDVFHSAERPCLQPCPQVPASQASDSASRGPLQHSFSSHNLLKQTPTTTSIRVGTSSMEVTEDSPLLAHARSSATLSLAQASPLSSNPLLSASSAPNDRCAFSVSLVWHEPAAATNILLVLLPLQ